MQNQRGTKITITITGIVECNVTTGGSVVDREERIIELIKIIYGIFKNEGMTYHDFLMSVLKGVINANK